MSPNRPDATDRNGTAAVQPLTPAEKMLRWAVYIMGVLLVIGLVVVAVTIVKRAGSPAPKRSGFEALDLKLDAAMKVERMVLDGDRLAMHVSGPDGEQVIIVNVRHGNEIGRIRLK